jgi:hypothetical protein
MHVVQQQNARIYWNRQPIAGEGLQRVTCRAGRLPCANRCKTHACFSTAPVSRLAAGMTAGLLSANSGLRADGAAPLMVAVISALSCATRVPDPLLQFGQRRLAPVLLLRWQAGRIGPHRAAVIAGSTMMPFRHPRHGREIRPIRSHNREKVHSYSG